MAQTELKEPQESRVLAAPPVPPGKPDPREQQDPMVPQERSGISAQESHPEALVPSVISGWISTPAISTRKPE